VIDDTQTPQPSAPEGPPLKDPGEMTPVPTPPAQKPETDKIRPSYTKKAVDDILTVLKSGGKRYEAFTWARISKNAFYEWLREIPEFREQVEAAEAGTRVYAISQLWKGVRAGNSVDVRFWIERNVPGWRPAPSTVVKQSNTTHVHNHAENVKKARQRVYERTGRRPAGSGSPAAG